MAEKDWAKALARKEGDLRELEYRFTKRRVDKLIYGMEKYALLQQIEKIKKKMQEMQK